MIVAQLSVEGKVLRYDSGGEYQDWNYKNFLANQNLVSMFLSRYPQQNKGSREEKYTYCHSNSVT